MCPCWLPAIGWRACLTHLRVCSMSICSIRPAERLVVNGLIAAYRLLKSVCWGSSVSMTCRLIWCLKPGLLSCGAVLPTETPRPAGPQLLGSRVTRDLTRQRSLRHLARLGEWRRCRSDCAVLALQGDEFTALAHLQAHESQLDTPGLLDLALLVQTPSSLGTSRVDLAPSRRASVHPSP